MEEDKDFELEKMKRPELEQFIKDNNIAVESKVGMSNKELVDAIEKALTTNIEAKNSFDFASKTRLEIITMLEERALERGQLLALIVFASLSFAGGDAFIETLDDDELADNIALQLSASNDNDGDKGADSSDDAVDALADAVSAAKEAFPDADVKVLGTAKAMPKTAKDIKEEVIQGMTDEKITAKQRAYARKLCVDLKVTEVFVNPAKNEYFTQKCKCSQFGGWQRKFTNNGKNQLICTIESI